MDLPIGAGPEREQAILDAVKAGEHDAIPWITITSDYNGHHGEFKVFADALKIDGIRVNVTARTQQLIADELGCMLLTPKLCDLMWVQRNVTITPFPQGASKDMGSTAAMIKNSQSIDKALEAQQSPDGLISTVGKNWCLSNELLKAPGRALNYGWHFVGQTFQGSRFGVTASRLQDENGQYIRLIQDIGTRHNMNEADYSQICQLVHMDSTIDGNSMKLIDVCNDPVLANLVNVGGKLFVTRQPGV